MQEFASPMIRWKCPQCESTVGAPEWATGRRVPCPVCTNGIKVPFVSDDDPVTDEETAGGAKKTGCVGCIVVFGVVLFLIFVLVKVLI